MAILRGPRLITDESLLVNLDASALRSAPDSSSGWTNIVNGGGLKV